MDTASKGYKDISWISSYRIHHLQEFIAFISTMAQLNVGQQWRNSISLYQSIRNTMLKSILLLRHVVQLSHLKVSWNHKHLQKFHDQSSCKTNVENFTFQSTKQCIFWSKVLTKHRILKFDDFVFFWVFWFWLIFFRIIWKIDGWERIDFIVIFERVDFFIGEFVSLKMSNFQRE